MCILQSPSAELRLPKATLQTVCKVATLQLHFYLSIYYSHTFNCKEDMLRMTLIASTRDAENDDKHLAPKTSVNFRYQPNNFQQHVLRTQL